MKKKILLLLVTIITSIGMQAQDVDEFFRQFPRKLPSLNEFAYAAAFYSYPDDPGYIVAEKHVSEFAKQVENPLITMTTGAVKQHVASATSVLGAELGAKYAAMVDSLMRETEEQYPDESDDYDEVSDISETGVQLDTTAITIPIYVATASSANSFAENGWKTDLYKWMEDYTAYREKLQYMHEDLLDFVSECKEDWYREYSPQVSRNNREIDELKIKIMELEAACEDGNEAACDEVAVVEKRIKTLNLANCTSYYRWGCKRNEELMPLLQEFMKTIVDNIPLEKGMAAYRQSNGSESANGGIVSALWMYTESLEHLSIPAISIR